MVGALGLVTIDWGVGAGLEDSSGVVLVLDGVDGLGDVGVDADVDVDAGVEAEVDVPVSELPLQSAWSNPKLAPSATHQIFPMPPGSSTPTVPPSSGKSSPPG